MKNKANKAMMLIQPKAKSNNVYQLYIYDEVTPYGEFDFSTWEYLESETSANYFKKQLESIPDDATIELFINSCGGFVSEGVSIYNQLARHKAHKVAYVDGAAYSVASLIPLACDHIVMGKGTSMLVHEMWVSTAGNAKELRKAADDLDKLMESNRQVYMQRFTGTEEELIALMAEERYLTPEECLEYGLCDEIAGMKKEEQQSNNPDMKQLIENLVKQQAEEIGAKICAKMMEKGGNPEPGNNPEENKCVTFFEQFMN